MTNPSPRIVFMGTPEFAVASLQRLIEVGYNVVAVVTATDKLGGRGGKQLIESDVKRYAVSQGIPVLQPNNLKSPSFIDTLRSYHADIQCVVAFRMLPEAVWNMPRLGSYNVHGSLLPKYRGAAPIHWSVINGDSETGVTTFKLQHEIDTGDISIQKKMSIGPDETTGEIHDRMMVLGAEALVETLQKLEVGDVSGIVQDTSLATKAPKIFHETCLIDFSRSALEVHNFIRGMSPFPGAHTVIDGIESKILKSSFHPEVSDMQPGQMLVKKSKLYIGCQVGAIEVLNIKMSGKRLMSASDLLNGYSINSLFAG